MRGKGLSDLHHVAIAFRASEKVTSGKGGERRRMQVYDSICKTNKCWKNVKNSTLIYFDEERHI